MHKLLVAKLQFELWIGDAAEIRTTRVRKQKPDRRDAQLILRSLPGRPLPTDLGAEIGEPGSSLVKGRFVLFGDSTTEIWVQQGSIDTFQVFLKTPKVAANAVGCQSVMVKSILDTVEVRSSSLLVPTISFNQFE